MDERKKEKNRQKDAKLVKALFDSLGMPPMYVRILVPRSARCETLALYRMLEQGPKLVKAMKQLTDKTSSWKTRDFRSFAKIHQDADAKLEEHLKKEFQWHKKLDGEKLKRNEEERIAISEALGGETRNLKVTLHRDPAAEVFAWVIRTRKYQFALRRLRENYWN